MNRIRNERARASVIAEFAPMPGSAVGEPAASFDIVLGQTPQAG